MGLYYKIQSFHYQFNDSVKKIEERKKTRNLMFTKKSIGEKPSNIPALNDQSYCFLHSGFNASFQLKISGRLPVSLRLINIF